jgi:hypothetical protein
MLRNNLINFAKCEDGAITVDWVVLTAGVIGMVLAVLITLGGGVADHAEQMTATMSDRDIPSF